MGRWEDVRREDVGEGESRKLNLGINRGRAMALVLLPSDSLRATLGTQEVKLS